jgi:hypothetical protein
MKRKPPREWYGFSYYDPKGVLLKLREIEQRFAGHGIDEKIFRLRTNDLRGIREGRVAAIFSYGISTAVLGAPVRIASVEKEDFDFLVCTEKGNEVIFTPVQLKELAPADLNPTASLDTEIAKLGRYVSSSDLVVAFHLNREQRVDFSSLHIPPLPIAELWFFGALSADNSKWILHGNALHSPKTYTFGYPT